MRCQNSIAKPHAFLRCSYPISDARLDFHRRLVTVAAERGALIEILDRFRAGVVLFDTKLRVVVMNRAASRLAEARDGFVVRKRQIRCATPGATAQLTRALGSAAATARGEAIEAGNSCARGIAGISFYREEGKHPFETPEVQFLDALTPHLRRALRLHDVVARAAHEREVALEGLDAVSYGVLLVTSEGRVMHANRAAQAIVRQRDGLMLDHSLLTAATASMTTRLRQLCMECARTSRGDAMYAGSELLLERPSGRRGLQVVVCPVKRNEPFGIDDDRVTAVVFVSEPGAEPLPNAQLLRAFYQLTAAEAEIAARLAGGESVDEIASACGKTKQTVQWYSKQILATTGCRHRAALVRQLSSTLLSRGS